MTAEASVPVGRLEKLVRRYALRSNARRRRAKHYKGSGDAYAQQAEHERELEHAWGLAAADLRAIIDEAKGEGQ